MAGCQLGGSLAHTILGLLLGVVVFLQVSEGRSVLEPTFDYSKSGTDWPGVCASGQSESPVNIVRNRTKDAADVDNFYIHYRKSSPVTLFNFAAVELEVEAGCDNFLYTPEGKFRLTNIHTHANSEHSINGAVFPLEVHFVHRHETENKISVVAVLFKLHPDDRDNPLLDRLVSNIPHNRNERHSFTTNLEEMFNKIVTRGSLSDKPAPLDYYTYHGSLTVPPCSENVTWYIRQRYATVSVRQWLAVLAANRAVWGEKLTSRPVQPLHGRVIYKHRVVPRRGSN